MLIDDDNLNLTIMTNYLNQEGYNNIIALHSAIEAYKYLGLREDDTICMNPDIDLIITDIIMPEIDGIQLCKEVRKYDRFKDVPIIAITASDNNNYIKEVFEAGAFDYIKKPIMPIELVARTNSALKFHKEVEARVNKEKELQDIKDKYLTQVAVSYASKDGMVIIDEQYKITWYNDSFNKIFQKNNNYYLNKKITEIDSNIFNNKKLEKILNKLRDNKRLEIINGDFTIKTFKGITVIIEVYIQKIITSEGGIAFVIIYNDVTERETSRIQIVEDLQTAKMLQKSMLPESIEDENISIEGYYQPQAYLGGDMYYWMRLDNDKYIVLVMDIMGHGTTTSLVSMYIRSLIPGLLMKVKDPKTIIDELNKHMNRFNSCINNSIGYYFTAAIAFINTGDKTIKYINAGHPMPIFYHNNKIEYMDIGCVPIGLIDKVNVQVGELVYEDDFFILLYTDGISDSLRKEGIKIDDIVKKHIENNRIDLDKIIEKELKNIITNDDISMVLCKTS